MLGLACGDARFTGTARDHMTTTPSALDAHLTPTRQTDAARWLLSSEVLFWLITALGVAWMMVLGVQSAGTPLHDEVTHYFIARESWHDPARILDVWGRPGNTLFYILPSYITLGARRWWAIGATVLTVWLAAQTARRLGLRRVEWVALGFWLQPWVAQLGFTSITQIPFMLALTWGIERWSAANEAEAGRAREGRSTPRLYTALAWASLCFGLLPLIRHEGIVLTALWAGYLVIHWIVGTRRAASELGNAQQRTRYSASLQQTALLLAVSALPMVVWNIAHFMVYRRLASGNLFSIKPTDYYGSGDWLHFVAPTIANVGVAVMLLSAVGVVWLLRHRRGALLYALPALAYFATHTLIYRFGLFASGGYGLFLLPIAPTMALMAAWGISQSSRRDAQLRVRTDGIDNTDAQKRARTIQMVGSNRWRVLLVALAVVGCVSVLAVRPWAMQPNEFAMQDAADWLRANDYTDTPVYSTHIWFFWVYDGRIQRIPGGGNNPNPADIRRGALYLWDANYGNLDGITLDYLRQPNSGFTELATFGDGLGVLFRRD
jgi:hypothetical protein